MDFNCAKNSLNIKTLISILGLCVCSFPAISATNLYSIVEFNIAFVLGLSLPVLLVLVKIRKAIPNPWYYFAGVMVGVLGFHYALVYLNTQLVPTLLSFSSITLVFMCIWPFASMLKSEGNGSPELLKYFNFSTKAIASTHMLYIASVWLMPQLDAYIGWLIVNAVTLLSIALFIVLQSRFSPDDVYRLVGQWLATAIFVGAMFFWLNAQLSETSLIASFTALFLLTIVNSNWRIIQSVLKIIDTPKHDKGNDISASIAAFSYDPATNLPSYQHALISFEHLLKQFDSKRYAVIVVKPINFDHVNQILGHQNSDILLLQLAYCLQKQVAKNDNLVSFDSSSTVSRLARLQGLHFLTVIDLSDSNYPDDVMVKDLCYQLADAVPQAMSFKSFSLHFELACGVAFTAEHGSSVQEVIAHASDALLKAEKNLSLYEYYDEQHSLYNEQHLLRMEILHADIKENNLQWLAQPMIEDESDKIKGFTLIVKWRHLGNEYIELPEFKSLAEHSGDLYILTKQMIVQALKLLFELKKQNVFLPVSVSLSSDDVLQPDFADFIEEQIKTYNIAGKYLVIEILESVVVSSGERAKALIDQLRILDVMIGIDDFTGSYESLRYIRKLAIEQVKINCGRLKEAQDGSTEKAIVNSLVSLTRTMKLPMVGSEINHRDTLSMFEIMGGKVIQGDAVCSAMSVNDIPEWAKRWQTTHPDSM